MQKLIFIFPLFNGPYGGERHCLKLTGALAEKGFSVDIWTLRFPNSLANLLHPGIKLTTVAFPNIQHHELKTLMSIFWMRNTARALARTYAHKTEDMYLIGMGWQSVLCLSALRSSFPHRIYYCLEPPRFLYDLQRISSLGTKITARVFGPLLRTWDKKSVESVSLIIANSIRTRQDIEQLYQRESTVLPPGIEVERFQHGTKAEARKCLGLKNDPIYVSVGKLHKRKRIDAAIQLFVTHRMKQQTQEPGRLYIIGGGPEKSSLQRLVEDLKNHARTNSAAQHIFFLGEVNDDTVAQYLRAADYCIFTAQNEPFGLVIQEAKAAGCTILPHDIELPLLSWETSAEKFLTLIREAFPGTRIS